MTAPAVDPRSLGSDQQDSALHTLSQLVSGNKNLIDQPGLVQALYLNKATPAQAGAIDQFMSGLNAEMKVRAASMGGNKIDLDDTERQQLDLMGIDYHPVWNSPQDQQTAVHQRMAAQGLQPVKNADGSFRVDNAGNVLAEKIPQQKKGRGFWGSIGHFLGNNPVTSFVTHGTVMPARDPLTQEMTQFNGAAGVGNLLNSGYKVVNTDLLSHADLGANPFDQTAQFRKTVQTSAQNAQLMTSLGYDPNDPMSLLAFQAHGYEHTDTSSLASKWDTDNPTGLFGWDGQTAVLEAEKFAANPAQYRQGIVDDQNLTPEQQADKLKNISSPQFSDLVKEVNGRQASIGNNFARGIGLDPVQDHTAFALNSGAVDLIAAFSTDPLAVGLGTFNTARRTAAAIDGFADDVRIGQLLDPAAKTASSTHFRIQSFAQDVVDVANQVRAARAAGDEALAASLQARLKGNPFAGLLEDATGANQLTRTFSQAELAKLRPGDIPEALGPGDPLDTYEKFAGYITSKNALLRLQGGLAPVEASVMPGALSSYGWAATRGRFAQAKVYRSLVKGEANRSAYLQWATNPARVKAELDAGNITRVLPEADDAVDVLKQQVIAAEQKVTTNETLASQWGQEAATAANKYKIAFGHAKQGLKRPDLADLQSNAGMAQAASQKAVAELESSRAGLASAQRALNSKLADLEAGPMYQLTPQAEGDIAFNLRAFGKATEGKSFQLGNVIISPGAFTPRAIAARARLAASRLTNQLPTDRKITLMTADAVDSIGKIASTYLSPGDAELLKLRFAMGDGGVRQSIVQGLKQTLAHASGLPRTRAGQDILKRMLAEDERYATNSAYKVVDESGKETALFPGQVQEHFILPNFGELHRASAKIGLYEATLGNIFNIPALAHALGMWRMMILSTQVTAIRASIESWLNAGANGMFTDGAKAKALLHELGGLEGLAGRSRFTNAMTSLPVFKQMGQMYRAGLIRQFDNATADEMSYYIDSILQSNMLEQASAHAAAYIDPAGMLGIQEAAKAGLMAKHFTVNPKEAWTDDIRQVRTGYELTDDLDGIAGAGKYADALRQRFTNPELGNALLDRIERPTDFGPDHVVAALAKPQAKRLMDQTQYGRIYWDSDGIQRKAITDAQQALGREQFADRMANEVKDLLTGRNGNLNPKLIEKLRKDGAPDSDWIHQNVKGMWRPAAVLAPTFDAVVTGGKTQFIHSLEDVSGKMYQLLVERFIQRHATAPLHAAAYLDAKRGLEGYKQGLIADGISEDAAQAITAELANRQAWSRVARMVDDPRLKMQMDVVGRSFFAFSRATTMMLRRWGQTAWANPDAARRMMLAGEAAVHSGLVQKDTNGNWIFKVPMSGAAMGVINDAIRHIPGFAGAAAFPTADLTGNVTSIIPGSNDPFQYGTTPMVSIAGRQLASMFPPDARETFDRLDSMFNGQAGQGRGIVETLEPTMVKRITEVLNNDERNSMTASSMIGSLYNLYATNQVPPEGASDVEWDDFYRKLKTQTKNNLFVRGAFALFSPARLDSPEASGPAADFAYQASGAQGLRDEFKQLLNDTGGDFGRSLAIWAALHPDLTVYTQSASEGSTSNAVMPATQSALQWMDRNGNFIQKYQHVSAYFIPEAPGNYSQAAYRAQLEAGLRRRKTPTQFYQDVRKATDANEYYAVDDKFKSDYAQALASGNTTLAASRKADWLAWSKQYKAVHPIFASDLAGWADTRNTASGQLRDLHAMVKNGDVPGDLGPYVSGMLQAYDGYVQFAGLHPGNTALARAQRSQAFNQLQDYMTTVVQQKPELKDLYQGVFRKLNSNLENENEGI